MATIKQATLPKNNHGNDPNDLRGDTDYLKHIEPIENEAAMQKANIGLNWTEGFKVTKQEANTYDHPAFLYPNLIISGHVTVIPAPPNGGKTTIMMYVAGELARNGLDVYYVNADVGQADAKSMVGTADAKGFNLLLPDMKTGLSMQDVVSNLERMNEENGNFSSIVFIFDTLKKMTDVINKTRSKDLYKLFRSLSAKGMTIILLAHTNKYADADGRPIFEGTGDLRADVDEMIYFVPKKNDDGSMTVSTEPDKIRGKFSPITFHISPEREVSQKNEYINVIGIAKAQQQREDDGQTIELITEAITAEQFTEAKITAFVKAGGGGGWRTVKGVLKRYTGKLWSCEPGFQNNAKRYYLI